MNVKASPEDHGPSSSREEGRKALLGLLFAQKALHRGTTDSASSL